LARYVLTNVSNDSVRGCVSVQRRWTFTGTDKTSVVERSGTHQFCRPDQEFFLGADETFAWLDAVTVPDVGEGEIEVAVEIDIVLSDTRGKAPWKLLSTVHRSFTIHVEASSPGRDV
jgi:hypothetical protein